MASDNSSAWKKSQDEVSGPGSDYREVKSIFHCLPGVGWVSGGHLQARCDSLRKERFVQLLGFCGQRAFATYCWNRVRDDIKVSYGVAFKVIYCTAPATAADSMCSHWWYEMMAWRLMQSGECSLSTSSWNCSIISGCTSESGSSASRSESTEGLVTLFKGISSPVCVEIKRSWTVTGSSGNLTIGMTSPTKMSIQLQIIQLQIMSLFFPSGLLVYVVGWREWGRKPTRLHLHFQMLEKQRSVLLNTINAMAIRWQQRICSGTWTCINRAKIESLHSRIQSVTGFVRSDPQRSYWLQPI